VESTSTTGHMLADSNCLRSKIRMAGRAHSLGGGATE
jgi:hypothetical protein